MKRSVRVLCVSGLLCVALTVIVQAQSREINLARLDQVDFENLPLNGASCPSPFGGEPTLTNPLAVDGLIITDPVCLRTAFCSAPTCEPDPDNPDGGNISVFLNPGGTIEFSNTPKLAVLDIQGIGDNPFTLRITGARGETYDLEAAGILFGETLVRVFSPRGLRSIEVLEVGGTGGPLSVASVYLK